MKLHIVLLITSIFIGLSSCKTNVKQQDKSNNLLSSSELTYEQAEIGFYVVYRLQDEISLQFLRNVKAVEQFTPVFNLDIGNYSQNIFGITEEENNKIQILNKLLSTDSLSSNSKLVWSKRKQFNIRTNEEVFHLYMLKKNSKMIANSDIQSAIAKKNPYGEDYIVEIIFSTLGTQKWSNMTKKAYEDDENYIAIVINEEVYSCPYMMGQLDSPYFFLNEFENLEEATRVAKGIMKKVDNKQ